MCTPHRIVAQRVTAPRPPILTRRRAPRRLYLCPTISIRFHADESAGRSKYQFVAGVKPGEAVGRLKQQKDDEFSTPLRRFLKIGDGLDIFAT